MKKYTVYLSDPDTHVVKLAVTISADGYLTALAKANEFCLANYSHLYVSKVDNG